MALGGIILYLQHQNEDSAAILVGASCQFTVEFRVRFPGPTNDDMPPNQLSGSLWTLNNGSTGAGYLSLWYEKAATTSYTGNVYLTSSAGRLELVSGAFFDDSFYNFGVVKEFATGSTTVYAHRYEGETLAYSTSSVALTGAVGYPLNFDYTKIELGESTLVPSSGQFWGHEFRLWRAPLAESELQSHAAHFESYGRERSHSNSDLLIHWRLAEGDSANGSGAVYAVNSAFSSSVGTGSNFTANESPYDKFLEGYAYIPGIDYGWNQEKVRVFDGSVIDPWESYQDERLVSLEFNMYDALNEDVSHLLSSYDELGAFLGLPINRYREEYEGLQQMRETYFKRLQGKLNFRVFADMLDFFDTSFVSIVERLLPARAIFKGDELVVESHMLERPKYQYQLRPIREGIIDISGSISVTARFED